MKNYPRRYVNENAVKKALKIDSFRNLSKEKVMQFASMIPYMDKEVAMKVIDQFPVYADFGKAAIEQYTKTCDNILEKNKESQEAVIHGYQTILEVLAKKMDKENLTEEEKAKLRAEGRKPAIRFSVEKAQILVYNKNNKNRILECSIPLFFLNLH